MQALYRSEDESLRPLSRASSPDTEALGQAEAARMEFEAQTADRRCRGLRAALEVLIQRELALANELDRAAVTTPPAAPLMADIAVQLAQARLGIAELDRLVREAERRRAEAQRRAMDVRLALSIHRPRPDEARTTPT